MSTMSDPSHRRASVRAKDRFAGWIKPWRMALVAMLGVAACATAPVLGSLGLDVLQSSQQFVTTRLDQSWAAPRGALIAIQRSLGVEQEQIIGLVNDTTIDGDNFLWLRARVPDGRAAGRFNLNDFLSRTEGVPVPFSAVSDQDLRQGTDTLGTYFYLEYRTGGQTNCVLAFRRIDGASRLLPRGTNVLEVMLRNCVQGSIDVALAPITDRQIGVGAVAGVQTAAGGTRMLSPLAAPELP